MKAFFRFTIKCLLFLWQLPQCLVGITYFLFYRLKGTKLNKKNEVIEGRVYNSVSLGEWVFVTDSSESTRKHELGHRRQSRMLGPLYLIIVGLPSLFWNITARFSPTIAKNYYHLFPENWADRLGKVDRKREES